MHLFLKKEKRYKYWFYNFLEFNFQKMNCSSNLSLCVLYFSCSWDDWPDLTRIVYTLCSFDCLENSFLPRMFLTFVNFLWFYFFRIVFIHFNRILSFIKFNYALKSEFYFFKLFHFFNIYFKNILIYLYLN